MELWFIIKKKKLWYFGTMEKTMVVWKQLWYYGENYDTIPKTMKLRFAMEKLWYYGKHYGTIVNYS